MIDLNFALDAGQSRAEDLAWRMSPKATSPSLNIVLERVDPARNIARYYVLSIEPTLFAKQRRHPCWGRIGCLGLGNVFSSSELKTRREPK